MKLVDIGGDVEVVRDGAFHTLGLLTSTAHGLLVFAESAEWADRAAQTKEVTCVMTTRELASRIPTNLGVATSESPREAFYALHNRLVAGGFYSAPFETTIARTARVHPRAYVAERNVRIGERCVVEPNATILEGTILDEDVIIRAGAVIGGEGFQVFPSGQKLVSVRHGGGVHVEARAEIQHNAVIDRAVFGEATSIGEDTRIDNLVHIAHNVRLGRRNRVVAGAMIAGSVVSRDDVWFGPMCSVSHGLRVGTGAFITMGAVVTRDVPDGAKVSGNFAIDHARFIAHMRAIR
jgi:UDP-3-O-[3-hydroxymyristoyl] glucosamine N-acyltransferase